MKNVKNANYWQVDHKVKNVFETKGIIILSSPQAWQKFSWTRKYFGQKPKEGYFIWVKEQVDFPLTACITIASKNVSQNLINLLVIEKNIKAKANVVCAVASNNLCGIHKAQGKLILKDKASLEYNHIHRWGKKDFVSPNYQFILGKNSRLIYNYKNLFPPENLKLNTTIYGAQHSSCNLNFVINGLDSEINLEDTIFLEGLDARGIVRLRLVGRKNSKIKAVSSIVAKAPVKGHLDCQGLLIDKNSEISLKPELVCKNNQAQITHEASVGKISEEQLNYLRTRGLSEKEAINLIVAGFLEIY